MDCVPLWLRVGYAVLVVVLAPIYAVEYGLINFLWFSNVALILTLVGIWIGSRLLISMMALAVVIPEIGWNLDFWFQLLTGIELFGFVSYMFEPRYPLWLRLLSLFHVPLPFLLVWLVWRCGYDSRALRWQTVLAWVLLTITFVISEPFENVNFVYGIVEQGRPVIDPPWPLLGLMIGLPLVVYLPTHAALKRLVSSRERQRNDSTT